MSSAARRGARARVRAARSSSGAGRPRAPRRAAACAADVRFTLRATQGAVSGASVVLDGREVALSGGGGDGEPGTGTATFASNAVRCSAALQYSLKLTLEEGSAPVRVAVPNSSVAVPDGVGRGSLGFTSLGDYVPGLPKGAQVALGLDYTSGAGVADAPSAGLKRALKGLAAGAKAKAEAGAAADAPQAAASGTLPLALAAAAGAFFAAYALASLIL